MTKEEKEKQMQEKYMEMQMLNMQMQQFQRNLEAIEQQCTELEKAQESMDSVLGSEKGVESFSMLAPGVFVRSKVENTENVIVNVGSGVLVEKPIKTTMEDVAGQIAELRTVQHELSMQLEKLTKKATNVEEELRALV